jgi:hypothetical protein
VEGPHSKTGHTEFILRDDSNITVATSIKDPDKCFAEFMRSVTACVPPQQQRGMKVGG